MASAAVAPVYSDKEIYRYIDLGLGRGVDASEPTPWLNKSSFQVRRVTADNIIGTDEGGTLHKYENEVSSVRTQQSKMKTSVVVPKSPVTISAEAEYSRSVHSSRRSIGRKVVNRTISFSDNFNDVPFGKEVKKTSQSESQKYLTFEERLADWIMEKLKIERGDGEHLEEESEYPLYDLSKVIEKGSRSDMKLIVKICQKFVEYFHITHYVSSIQLGAVEYQVFTQREYNTAASVTTKTDVAKIGGASMQHSYSSKGKQSSSDLKCIGFINEKSKVERGSSEEAVINVGIKPISTLIKTAFLNACMETALRRYMEIQRDKSDGPFLICCGIRRCLYLYVDEERHVVLATSDINNASEFCIVPSDDKMGINEFYIVYYKQMEETGAKDTKGSRYSVLCDVQDDENSSSISLYVDAPQSVWGNNPGPLPVRDAVSQKTCRFVLNERLLSDKGLDPASLEQWTNGKEMFYISCSRRAFRRDGYLAVRKQAGGHQYLTCCISDISSHDNQNTFMLFRLLPRKSEYSIDNEEESKEASHQPVPGESAIM